MMQRQKYEYKDRLYTIVEFNGEYRFEIGSFWSGWTDELHAHKLAKEYIDIHSD